MKTLILLRHAKAQPGASEFDDFDRILTPDGRRAADRIGRWLAANELTPGLALVSAASRAHQTWDIVAPLLGDNIAEQRERALYLAPPGEILAQIAAADDTVSKIILVGHNPGLESLARMLSGAGSIESAVANLARGMPTAGLAVFSLDIGPWHALASATTRLTAFIRPNDLASAD